MQTSILELSKESSGSRAIAAAMRALQEKIRMLQTDNDKLSQSIIALEDKALEDRDKFQQRFTEEFRIQLEKEQDLTSKVIEFEEEVSRTQSRTCMMEEQIKILEAQILHIESEKRRNLEQYTIDKENLTLQLENAEKLIHMQRAEEEKVLIRAKHFEKDRVLLENEIEVSKSQINSLQSELEHYRSQVHILQTELNSTHKSYENARAQLILVNLTQTNEKIEVEHANKLAEFKNTIRELEDKNKGLDDISNNQKTHILSLRREIEELKREVKLSEEARVMLLKEKNNTQTFVNDIVSVNEQLIDTLKREKTQDSAIPNKIKDKKPAIKHTGKRKKVRSRTSSRDLAYASPRTTKPNKTYKFRAHHKEVARTPESESEGEMRIPERKEHDFTKVSNDKTEEKLKARIQELDTELEELNRRYKQALLKSPSEGADLSMLRNELNSLASLMENTSKELYALKRKHQEILREKVFKI